MAVNMILLTLYSKMLLKKWTYMTMNSKFIVTKHEVHFLPMPMMVLALTHRASS